jgi:hypothetical protein
MQRATNKKNKQRDVDGRGSAVCFRAALHWLSISDSA